MREIRRREASSSLAAAFIGCSSLAVVGLIALLFLVSRSFSTPETKPTGIDTTPLGVPMAVQVYARKALPDARSMGGEFKLLSRLFDQASENPNLIYDRDWRFEVDQSLVRVQHASARLATIQPVPPDFRGVDSSIKFACNEIPLMALNINFGFQNMDPREFAAADERAAKIGGYFQEATAEMERVSRDYPGFH